MFKSNFKKILSLILVIMLMLPGFSNIALANSFDEIDITESLNQLSKDEYEIVASTFLDVFAQLKINDLGTFEFDEKTDFLQFLENDQIIELKENFESLTADEVTFISEQVGDISPDAVAIPVTLGALLTYLITIGLGWLVSEILNYGIRVACKNHADVNNVFWNFCDLMGYI